MDYKVYEMFEFFDDYIEDMQEELDESTGFLFGRKKKKKGKLFNKIGSAIKKAGEFVERNVKSAGKDIASAANEAKWLPLMPFMPAMLTALKAKGHNPPKKISDVAPMFYRVVVQGKSNYDFPESFYEGDTGNFAPSAIISIVRSIIQFIQGAKEAKEKGEPMDGLVGEFLSQAEGAARNLFDAAEKGGEKAIIQSISNSAKGIQKDAKNIKVLKGGGNNKGNDGGGFKMDNNMLLILGAVVVVIFISQGKKAS